ncbi:hypothetical protein [Amedibacterium intestinale]|uniref:hypothetical protein n=1 Tax=Amedibacterium intestinale TaxID=2583452 RepID=UPI000E2039DF
MGRVYDVINRLKARNERPCVILDEEHKYPINTSKTNVLMIMGYIRKKEKENKQNDDPEDDVKMSDKLIEMALGKEALDYINSQDMTMVAVSDIVQVIVAAISDTEVKFDEEVTDEKK